MIWESTLLKLMRFVLQATALVLGSTSILALWASFYAPKCGLFAFIMLFTASFIALGLPQPAPARRGGPGAGWRRDAAALAALPRRWREIMRLRLSRRR